MSKGGEQQPQCPFCRLDYTKVLRCNPHAVAFRDAFPVSSGHTLVVPIQHVQSIFDVHEDGQQALWTLVGEVRAKLAEELHPDGFNVGLNDGLAAGQTVPHAHIHVIPRYKGDVADPRGGIRWIVPSKAKYWQ